MHFTATLVLAAASIAAAQTTSAAAAVPTDTGICAQESVKLTPINSIVDACVTQYDKQIKTCEGNDWICLCDNYTNKLTCYNNCMGSDERPPVQNQVTQFCNAAAPLKSSSLAAAKTESRSVSAPASTSTGESTTTGTSSASATVPSASGFATGAAVALGAPMGGAVAVLLGLAGML
ncbi:hypothetical protein N0V90_009054 [Kalmusia sp. IMI 367209]|nr:hypothetical protein N0V90_009054 [Kalmusia sp. IMI 367209]